MQAMSGAHQAIKGLQKANDLDKMQDLLEDIQDQEAEQNELNEMFQNKANENMDDV